MRWPCDFAVVDLETTGLSPAYHHRVVELAVVHVSSTGEISDEWCSLINPQRHVSATEIHGITPRDLFSAPTFEDIAGDLVERLRGRIVVAHNLPFDASFLRAEFARLGISVPISFEQGLCTMRLAAEYLRASRRSLEACCDVIGYRATNSHCALDDARAAAQLLSHFLHIPDFGPQCLSHSAMSVLHHNWPDLTPCGVATVMRHEQRNRPREHFLEKLVSRATASVDHSHTESYLHVLDRALLDRDLSLHEEAELILVATNLGLSREQAVSCHRDYIQSLARLALQDGEITSDELDDLHNVANLLGVDRREVDELLASSCSIVPSAPAVGRFALAKGDAIVFTGDEPGLARGVLEQDALSAGLVVKSSVSKKISLVIASDPDSLSGKAQKARTLGIPIVSYACYLNLLDQLIPHPE